MWRPALTFCRDCHPQRSKVLVGSSCCHSNCRLVPPHLCKIVAKVVRGASLQGALVAHHCLDRVRAVCACVLGGAVRARAVAGVGACTSVAAVCAVVRAVQGCCMHATRGASQPSARRQHRLRAPTPTCERLCLGLAARNHRHRSLLQARIKA